MPTDLPFATSPARTSGRRRARVGLPVLAAALALGAAACGSDAGAKEPGDHHTATTVASPADAATTRDITTINGAAPEGEMLPLQDLTTMLDTIDANGNRLVVTRGVRRAGTRVAIHTHRYGGHTCVLSGTITDFVEGHEPMVWPAGTCYYMPPGTLMAAANLGTEDAVLIDTFNLPPGEPTITIREPGWPE